MLPMQDVEVKGRFHRYWMMAAAAALFATAHAQTAQWKAGDQVELQANGEHWQKCAVTDPGDPNRVMRMLCEPYTGAGYSRGGGVFTESWNSKAVRRAGSQASTPAAARVTRFVVGQKVEIEASQHWVPCTVQDIQYPTTTPLIRVHCTAYPALSRAEGIYPVQDSPETIRPVTGRIGPEPKPAAPVRAKPTPGNSLRVGEYACYGSGGRILGGLKFNITAPGRYTDAYGVAGTYAISNSTVRFRGGALDGLVGRELLSNNSFRVGTQAECEFWG